MAKINNAIKIESHLRHCKMEQYNRDFDKRY